jgi:hypothetical protein
MVLCYEMDDRLVGLLGVRMESEKQHSLGAVVGDASMI